MAWQPGDPINFSNSVMRELGYIKGAVRQGLGLNETQRLLSSLDRGIRKTDLSHAMRVLNYAYSDPSIYLPSDPSKPPDERLIPIAPTRQNRKYRVNVWYDVFDESLRTVEREYKTIDASILPDVSTIYQTATELSSMYDIPDRYAINSGIDFINVTDNPFYG